MNIWSLHKHRNIKLLLLTLQHQLTFNSFCIEYSENNDFESVFLFKKNQPLLRAYIFTYGQDPDKYGIHLEYPQFEETSFSNAIQAYEGYSLDQVVDTLVMHFEINDYELAV